MTSIWIGTSLFLIGSVLSYFAVGHMRGWAMRTSLLAQPNDRSAHRIPMPTGGGAPLVAITLLLWVSYVALTARASLSQVAAYAVGAMAIAGVSWIDDRKSVHYGWRLCVHLFGAVMLILGAGYWHGITLPVAGHIPLGYLGIGITIIWMVGLTNAFNFTDGIDGIAGSQALIAGLGWAMLGQLTGQIQISVLGIFLAACSQGFLGHNWQPARIFMGDVGSTFFGYSFAALPVIAAGRDPRLAVAGALLLWPCLFDSAFTVLMRLLRGQTVFAGHRTFLFHRLNLAGWTHSAVASMYGVLSATGLVFAYLWMTGGSEVRLGVLGAVPLCCITLWCVVLQSERRHGRVLVLLDSGLDVPSMEPMALEPSISLGRSAG